MINLISPGFFIFGQEGKKDMSQNYESLFTSREAAQYLGLAKITLDIWRSKGKPPAYVKIHRSVRYRREDLDAFILERRVMPE